MPVIAVYNVKGGVGKTTLAVNLAWASAVHSARKTLLWDLDPQGAATFILGKKRKENEQARAVLLQQVDPAAAILETGIDRLDLLPADTSLRSLDHLFITLGKKRRLDKLTAALNKSYERIILDCPPSLDETSDQIFRAASLIVVPIIPSPLSRRALDDVMTHLSRYHPKHGPVLAVFSMVDGRRALHKAAQAADPFWPVIPMASVAEQMSVRRAPVGAFASSSRAAQAFSLLWDSLETKLSKSK
jgi:chromosome partitioning protein